MGLAWRVLPKLDGAEDERVVFESARCEYYRQYCVLAQEEAVEAGRELGVEEEETIAAQVRAVGWKWAQAPQERLVFESRTFDLSLRVIPRTTEGVGFLEAEPRPAGARTYKGTWKRVGQGLVLSVTSVDEQPVTKPFDLPGYWRGDEIEILPFDAELMFPRIVLYRANR